MKIIKEVDKLFLNYLLMEIYLQIYKIKQNIIKIINIFTNKLIHNISKFKDNNSKFINKIY